MKQNVTMPRATLDSPPGCGSIIKDSAPEGPKGGYLNPQILAP